MSNYIEEYNECLKNSIININSQKQELNSLKKRYEQLSKSNRDEKRLQSFQKSIITLLHRITDTQEEILFLRPKTDEDIKYRENILNGSFQEKIDNLISDDLNLCFHGTPIHRAKAIIESGSISSSVDRLGFKPTESSEPNKINVVNKESINIGLTYMGISNFDFPAGCLFVIQNTSQEDINNSHKFNCIRNVNFKKHPERLYAIITTPENMNTVRKWCIDYEIPLTKVYDFTGFIAMLENRKKDITVAAIREYQSNIDDEYKVKM